MKKKITTLCLSSTILLSGITQIHADDTKAQASKLELSTANPQTNDGTLYEVKDNEILINDKLITLIAFGKNISAAYRNKTDKRIKPKYTIKIYNPYGMLIGKKEVGKGMSLFGSSTYMEPGEVSSEKIHLDDFPLKEILENSKVKVPEDILTKKWVVISNTNTK